ncbi:MAG: hypothetical protein IK015_00025 [Treponema sp.]|nr:hypothetical protein [Treponema sp.]
MGFFETVWFFLKRLLFIAAMCVCVVCGIFGFDKNLSGLGIFLNILTIVLAVGNCVLFFIFSEKSALFVNLGLIVQAILVVVLLVDVNDAFLTELLMLIAVLVAYNFKRGRAIENGIVKLVFGVGVVAVLVWMVYEVFKAFKH